MPSKGPTLVNHGFTLCICICIDSLESCLLRAEGACTGVQSFVSLTWVSPGSPSNSAQLTEGIQSESGEEMRHWTN